MQLTATNSALRHCSTLLLSVCLFAAQAGAATLTIRVRDRNGDPVPDVVAYALPLDHARHGGRGDVDPPTAVMDQRHRAFVPHILVVQKGTHVSFPNHDTVSHQVYSFSPAKRFELDLYKGTAHPPVTFDRAGVVILGCNIHDNMLGYIVVVDTSYFGKTDTAGSVVLGALPAGKYSIHIWTPRARDKDLPQASPVTLSQDARRELDFSLSAKLFPPFRKARGNLSWSSY